MLGVPAGRAFSVVSGDDDVSGTGRVEMLDTTFRFLLASFESEAGSPVIVKKFAIIVLLCLHIPNDELRWKTDF